MGEGKEEKKRDTLLYYIGEIYRGEGKGDLPRKGEGEVFAGGNWGENREFNGNLTEIKRGLSKKLGGTLAGIERESDRNQTKIERKTALTLLMQLGRDLFQGRKEQSFGFEKTCYLETKGLI